ncbi:ArsR/SmtB family transcription factor [Thalassospira sp. CH_XMU1448-2]|uniref:ArsR/SmtB family transcription factor n=1 Tax=Thalassospira sp. CH_XMU1448-2 TaxID=3107773 RepID=UPI0030080410
MMNDNPAIETTFNALADPTRRAVIQALSQGPASVSELAKPFEMALPSFTQHLGILENARLIVSHREGRSRICALNPTTLREAEDWLSSHRKEWEARLDRFETHLETMKKEQTDD